MPHQNTMFGGFVDIDKHQTPYSLNTIAYGAFAGSHYSNVGTPLNGMWGLSGGTPTAGVIHHPRANVPRSNCYPQPVQLPDQSYVRESYPSPPYTPTEHLNNRPQSNYNTPQHRTKQDIVHSMLTPVAEVPRSSSTNVRWERSGVQQAQARGLASPPSAGSAMGSEHFQWPPHSDNQFLGFDTGSWGDPMSSASDAATYMSSQLTFPPEQPHASSLSVSPSASHNMNRQVSPSSSTSSRRGSLDGSSGGKSCSHCHATTTPLWRREPNTLKPLCNACGLYLQQRNKHRPQELIDADAAADEMSDSSEGDATGPECSHCRTHHTSVWRRSKTGAQLCNACGVYYRLRGKDRPLSLKRNRIKPRSKHTPRAE